jgi:hypothetical protein
MRCTGALLLDALTVAFSVNATAAEESEAVLAAADALRGLLRACSGTREHHAVARHKSE